MNEENNDESREITILRICELASATYAKGKSQQAVDDIAMEAWQDIWQQGRLASASDPKMIRLWNADELVKDDRVLIWAKVKQVRREYLERESRRLNRYKQADIGSSGLVVTWNLKDDWVANEYEDYDDYDDDRGDSYDDYDESEYDAENAADSPQAGNKHLVQPLTPDEYARLRGNIYPRLFDTAVDEVIRREALEIVAWAIAQLPDEEREIIEAVLEIFSTRPRILKDVGIARACEKVENVTVLRLLYAKLQGICAKYNK